MFCAVVNPA